MNNAASESTHQPLNALKVPNAPISKIMAQASSEYFRKFATVILLGLGRCSVEPKVRQFERPYVLVFLLGKLFSAILDWYCVGLLCSSLSGLMRP